MTDLRKAAEAATPGPWFATDGVVWEIIQPTYDSGTPEQSKIADTNPQDAAYIAAANPQAILALLDERDALTARVVALEKALKPFADESTRYEPDEGDDKDTAWDSLFEIGDLRRAAAAMEKCGLMYQAHQALGGDSQ